MASSARGTLTSWQRQVLGAFVGLDGVYLTGGAALGHYYLGHRRTLDLDMFTPSVARLDDLSSALSAWCESNSAQLSMERSAATFRRYLVRGPQGASVVVDTVHEPVPQTVPVSEKPVRDGIRVDALEDIAANKLSAVLGRSEVKDLVDLLFLARAGHDPLSFLAAGRERDGGLDSASLAWVLTQMPLDPTDLDLLRPISEEQLRAFRDELVARLEMLAFPGP